MGRSFENGVASMYKFVSMISFPPISVNKEKKVFIFLFLAVWIYILLRAVFSPIIHDEAESFYIYIQTGNFVPPHAFWDANNHLLNSLFAFISWKLFGTSLIALRLPNVISALIYLFFVYKFAQIVQNRFNRWVFVFSMVFVHFIIEFFAYSRGYGMSMAFLLGAIYYLIRFIGQQKFFQSALMTLFMVLAALSNLTLMNTYLLIHILLFLSLIVYYRKLPKGIFAGTLATQLLIAFPVFVLLADYSLELKSRGALYYGSLDGFWQVTVGSLSKVLFRPFPELFQYAASAVLVAIIILFFYLLYKRCFNKKENVGALVFPLLLGGNIVISLILSKRFGVNYPEDRAAMYYYLLFIGSVFFITDSSLIRDRKWRIALFTPFLLVIIYFFMSLSLLFSSYSPEYRIPIAFYNHLIEVSESRSYPPIVEAYREHRSEWYFINASKGNKLGPLSHELFPSASAEYVVSNDRDFPDWRKNYTEVLFDSPSGMHLLKRKAPVRMELLCASDTAMSCVDSLDFFNFIISETDTLADRNVLFTIEMTVRADAVPFQAAVIAKAGSIDGSTVREQALELERMRPDWSAENGASFRMTMLLPQIPKNTNRILIFFFNKNKVPFQILKSEISMYSYY